MKRYLGIDVHRDSCTVVVLSAGGKKTDERVVPTEAASLVQCVRSLSGELHVCVEEGEWSEWLVELLSPRVHRVVSCTAPGRRGPRSDATDAHELAERLRTRQTGFPVYKASREWACLREAVRLEGKLVQDEVRAKQRLKSLYRRRGVACVNDEVYAPQRREEWNAKLPQSVRPSAEILGQELDQLLVLQQTAEQQMFAAATRFPMWKTLQTVPGIGRKRAAQLLAIVVTPHRFRTKRLFWSYCGLGVVTRSTSDWVRQKNGPTLPPSQPSARGLRADRGVRDQTQSGSAHHRAQDRRGGPSNVENRKRVPDHELSLSLCRVPIEREPQAHARNGNRWREELQDSKVEGESTLSTWAPSTMGVTASSLGPLTGPKEEMAHEALMEVWSHNSRTHKLASHLTSLPAPRTDPGTGQCSAQRLGNGKSHARSPDIEGSERLRLDIDFYGS